MPSKVHGQEAWMLGCSGCSGFGGAPAESQPHNGSTVPLTTITMILVGSYCKVLYRNCWEPAEIMVSVVEGRAPTQFPLAFGRCFRSLA